MNTGPEAELEAVAKGGIWSDENVTQSLDWQGEKAAAREPDLHQQTARQTKREERTEILKENNLSTEVVRALGDTLEERILNNSGFSAKSLKGAISSMIAENTERLKEWIMQTQADKGESEQQKKTSDAQVSALKERIITLERKIDEILVVTTERNTVELDIVKEAAQIVAANHREDAETGETPSEVHRMTRRADELEEKVLTMQRLTNAPRSPSSPAHMSAAEKRKKMKALY